MLISFSSCLSMVLYGFKKEETYMTIERFILNWIYGSVGTTVVCMSMYHESFKTSIIKSLIIGCAAMMSIVICSRFEKDIIKIIKMIQKARKRK